MDDKRELLEMVDAAIRQVLTGGVKSYKVGEVNLTALDLAELRRMRAELAAAIHAEENPGLLLGAWVGVFGRD